MSKETSFWVFYVVMLIACFAAGTLWLGYEFGEVSNGQMVVHILVVLVCVPVMIATQIVNSRTHKEDGTSLEQLSKTIKGKHLKTQSEEADSHKKG